MPAVSSRLLRLLKIIVFILGPGFVFFLVRSFYVHEVSSRSSLPPGQDGQMPQLLSEQRLRDLFTYDGVWLFPKSQCECEAVGWQNLSAAYSYRSLPMVNTRRQAEFEHFQRREGLPGPLPLLAEPNLPFAYPIHGLEVMPLHTILIPGLRFEGPDAPTYQVNLTASLGTLDTLVDISEEVVQGRGQKKLTISTRNQQLLNFILQHMAYTSTSYQHGRVDVVRLEFKSSVAKFPVAIRYPVMPKLYDPGPEGKLRNLVTIATKTFLRPHKLLTLLRSIREYYPDLTVIVADDSKKPLEIDDSYVEYYMMPFGKGWFAGRNLAVSQVTTKYVLWVDDDFIFNNKTKIEVLVDVLERTELDVVGGSVNGNTFQIKLFLEQGRGGNCLHRRRGSFGPLDGFPSCVVTSAVVNFFLAHTERLHRVGFDPLLQRVAHTEFFIDGLGSLLVGSCPEVVVGHQSHKVTEGSEPTGLEETYDRYRTDTPSQIRFKLALHYFKNHLRCYTTVPGAGKALG